MRKCSTWFRGFTCGSRQKQVLVCYLPSVAAKVRRYSGNGGLSQHPRTKLRVRCILWSLHDMTSMNTQLLVPRFVKYVLLYFYSRLPSLPTSSSTPKSPLNLSPFHLFSSLPNLNYLTFRTSFKVFSYTFILEA